MSSEPKMGPLGRVEQLSADSRIDVLRTFNADQRLALDPETQKRLREDAFRRAAYARVQADIRRARMTGLLVKSHGFCATRINTVEQTRTGEVRLLIDAVDMLLEKEGT